MTIERLEAAKRYVLSTEIKRQSVTDGDIEEAIYRLNWYLEHDEYYTDKWLSTCKLAIQAIKAYQVGVAENVKASELCEWCDPKRQGGFVCYKALGLTARQLVNRTRYCPSCGRRL